MLYIFDMGGVVLHNVFELSEILKNHNVDLDISGLYRDEFMSDYSSGRIDEQQYWAGFNSKYGTGIEAPQWGLHFNPQLDSAMVEMIINLKKTNRVVCGSNTIEPHWRKSVERDDYKCFHKVYASHLMGVAKPNPLFWESILDREGYSAGDTVFIDDFPENVKAAKSLGIKAILFKDYLTLCKELNLPHSLQL